MRGERKRKVGYSRGEREGYKPPYSIYFYFLLLREVIGPDESVLRGGWRVELEEPPRQPRSYYIDGIKPP